jgi:hypothetical protein
LLILGLVISPGVPVAVGLIAFLVIALLRRRNMVRPRTGTGAPAFVTRRLVFVNRVVGFGSLLVVGVFMAVQACVVLSLTVPMKYSWWLYPLPLLAVIACIAVLLIGMSREAIQREAPVVPVVRRGWLSFTRGWERGTATVALAALAFTCVFAGAASVPDDDGWYTLLPIPVGDLGPGFATFFGWAHGAPILAETVLLAALLYWVLRSNATRPFVSPDSVGTEVDARRETAAAMVRLVTISLLIPLGGSWLQIGLAGSGSVGVRIPNVGEFMYSSGYASFAPLFIWAGFAMQTAAVALLLLDASKRLPAARRTAAPAKRSDSAYVQS